MTVIIPIRLTPDEVARLNSMAYESESGAEGRGDFIRLLLHREYNRRHGLPKPKPSDWQGVYRVAGPKKKISDKRVPVGK